MSAQRETLQPREIRVVDHTVAGFIQKACDRHTKPGNRTRACCGRFRDQFPKQVGKRTCRPPARNRTQGSELTPRLKNPRLRACSADVDTENCAGGLNERPPCAIGTGESGCWWN